MAVLREAREATGISQRRLSTLLQRPKNFCSLVETGQRMLDISEFLAYVRAMDADPMKLFEEIVKRSPEVERAVNRVAPRKSKGKGGRRQGA